MRINWSLTRLRPSIANLSSSSTSSFVAPPCGKRIFIKPENVLLIPSRSRVEISEEREKCSL
ncbi:MAG: hypothetical protein BWY92_01026 [Firmicutes bacterium ADurb.BinA052]|nr:MAG: hypothetical protein BWY92_01026 [Firmicutes bacterium ADurb.BinA052]